MNDEESSAKDILASYSKVPREALTTDQSQGKGLASSSQTVGGKGSSNPFMAAALPKSRHVPTPTITVHGYQLATFDKDVYRTGRRITADQKLLLDNILYSFQEKNTKHMFHALYALTEELYDGGRNVQKEQRM